MKIFMWFSSRKILKVKFFRKNNEFKQFKNFLVELLQPGIVRTSFCPKSYSWNSFAENKSSCFLNSLRLLLFLLNQFIILQKLDLQLLKYQDLVFKPLVVTYDVLVVFIQEKSNKILTIKWLNWLLHDKQLLHETDNKYDYR